MPMEPLLTFKLHFSSYFILSLQIVTDLGT
jgi:hypothetical protein